MTDKYDIRRIWAVADQTCVYVRSDATASAQVVHCGNVLQLDNGACGFLYRGCQLEVRLAQTQLQRRQLEVYHPHLVDLFLQRCQKSTSRITVFRQLPANIGKDSIRPLEAPSG